MVVVGAVIMRMTVVMLGGSLAESAVRTSMVMVCEVRFQTFNSFRGSKDENERWVECSWMIDLSSPSKIASDESVKNPLGS
jgi:hypothetical protein